MDTEMQSLNLSFLILNFKTSKLYGLLLASAFSVFLRYHLTVFLPPLPEVVCPTILDIRNPWGKVMERIGLRFEHFSLEVV